MNTQRIINTALRLIKRNGQLVTWKKQNVQIANAAKPWQYSAGTLNPNSFQTYICFLPAGTSTFQALIHLIRGTDVPMGAPMGLMAPGAFTPEITDSVDKAGEILVIKSIDPLAPTGVPLLYTIEFA
jgi:hypothetical protein